MADDPKLRGQVQVKYEDLLEKAFDDEIDDVKSLLSGPPKLPLEPNAMLPDGTYSPLSEAAAGNAVKVAQYLLDQGANPNHVGLYNRTPLYRACFNEHEEVIPVLLEGGADPRKLLPQEFEEVTDEEEEEEEEPSQQTEDHENTTPKEKKKRLVPREWNPEEVPVPDRIKQILRDWDIAKTFNLQDKQILVKQENDHKVTEEMEKLKTDQEGLEHEARLAHDAWKDMLSIRENRIMEHDAARCEGRKEAAEKIIPLIEAAEKRVRDLRTVKEEIESKLSKIKGKVREHEVATSGLQVQSKAALSRLPDIIVDSSGEIEATGKCGLLIDPSQSAHSYLKYRNVVMVDMHSKEHMKPDKFIDALLGSIKYNRTFVLDIGMDAEDRRLEEAISAIDPMLYQLITANALITQNAYEYLITPALISRSPELASGKFPCDVTAWRFMVLTGNPFPEISMLETYYSILIQS
eukprot:TRINITY_DN1345_c1_g1_i1.p1 TRINITY_DN1345_c1_g1~~TRINITY_DN1345_c1_g1_i1.p1  ORF type:complete len:476 (+),score=94.15 TRINITY_DN1345_c1_g1_i1:37-1428(+)